jgi:hypothetical protein
VKGKQGENIFVPAVNYNKMQEQNKNLLLKQYQNILGLKNEIKISDIKKAYRILAKENHPDKFLTDDEKLRQSKIMADITEAYRYLIKYYDEEIKKEINPGDYNIYKSGLSYYNKYFDTFFKLFSKRKLITQMEKVNCLLKAKSFFDKLIAFYPESIWIPDVKEKMKKIESSLKNLHQEHPKSQKF